ncbi:hypothetical protein QYE76_066020 [Lolium multiflorum]|uniref:Peptidase S26 domain-containing protein n=1 Tax=Lolium multiflorum TaxID=4521 RepID=A0AAD8WAG4_LOLMU|nr:hypothetical protein QYE76_066020 [Lolium multiflorum]
MSRFLRRLAGAPWRAIVESAISRAVVVGCGVTVIDERVVSLTYPRGPSMLPAINIMGDLVVADKLSARYGWVSPGDVVQFVSPEDPRKTVIKRVLGMEGDAVTYLVDPANSDVSKTVVVPKGHIWVQGDNIHNSTDSRQFGPLPYGLVNGKICCRILPLKGFGSIDSKQ